MLGSSLALNVVLAPLAAQRQLLWPSAGRFPWIFYGLQKATLGSSLPLNVSRRPWRPSASYFGHLPGAFPRFSMGFRKRR